MKNNRLPIVLSLFTLLLDQGSKYLIIRGFIPSNRVSLLNGLVILNNQNSNSINYADATMQLIVQVFIPILVLLILIISLNVSQAYTKSNRSLLWVIVGGCLGNIIDRVIRPSGKIVFIEIPQFNFIPIFNIADIAVVFCSTIMLLSLILQNRSVLKHE